jgi:hypothetical protein
MDYKALLLYFKARPTPGTVDKESVSEKNLPTSSG